MYFFKKYLKIMQNTFISFCSLMKKRYICNVKEILTIKTKKQ